MKREETKLLEGAIDTHIHVSPDLKERLFDGFEAAEQAKKFGMKAIVIKNHYVMSAYQARIISEVKKDIDVFGGITLNTFIGGFNPDAVDISIKFGSKVVWMPTVSAAAHLKSKGKNYRKGLSVFKGGIDNSGEIRTEVKEILDLIAKANIVLATSHLSYNEIIALIKEARKVGVKKILITHPQNKYANMNIPMQKKVVEMGAYLEHCFNLCTPHLPLIKADDIAEAIHAVGPSQCIMATDMGQVDNFPPAEGLRVFIRMMLDRDIKPEWIKMMVKDNPTKLLSN